MIKHYSIEIDDNPDRCSEYTHQVTVSIDGCIIYDELAFSSEDAQNMAEEFIEGLDK